MKVVFKLYLTHAENVTTSNSMNIEITVAKNKKTHRIQFIIGSFSQNWYIFNKFLFNFSTDVR